MKRIILLIMVLVFSTTYALAYNPSSFKDEETINVQGKRPRVDIEVSELTVNILVDDFVDGVARKSITITNAGNVPCNLTLEIQNVPVDLNVEATVDTDRLFKDESTDLNITVALTDQQNAEDFTFTILINAEL